MRINSATIGMESARNYSSVSMEAYSLGYVRNTEGYKPLIKSVIEENKTKDSEDNDKSLDKEGKSLKDELSDLMEKFQAAKPRAIAGVSGDSEENAIKEIKARCIEYLLEILLGRRYLEGDDKYSNSDMYYGCSNTKWGSNGSYLTLRDTDNNLANLNNSLYRIESYEYYHEEHEEVAFNTTGCVVTADGREISFNLSAKMSRSFSEYVGYQNQSTVNLCDPLVINLNSSVTKVSDQCFEFDLDCDGIDEKVAKLCSGSSFLALDKNNDGEINDGSELFGAKSGDGFSDLAGYDSDNNGWIDENDNIFSKLLVFTIEENGDRTLVDLKAAGIGAICLGNVATDFTEKDEVSGEVYGRIRRSGMFLYEDGMAGTLAQVDLATSKISETA